MPDKIEEIFKEASQGSAQSYNPNLSNELDQRINAAYRNGLSSGGYSTQVGEADTPLFGANPNFNVTDRSTIDENAAASNSWWSDTYNDFWQSYYETQLNTVKGKMEAAGSFGILPFVSHEGPAAFIDVYPDRIKKLDNDLATNLITQAEYNAKRQELDLKMGKAQSEVADYQSEISEIEGKIAKQAKPSAAFKIGQALTQQKGDAASTFDRFYYGAGNTIGSSASLMLPNFIADFGNKAAQNILKVGIANAIPGLGEVADGIATTAALIGTVGEHLWSRAQETYAEIAEPIAEARQRLVSEYMQKNGLVDENQISPEVMRQIRIQSRQGVEKQFRENMFLAATDIASATLLPFSNIGYGLGKYAKGLSRALNATEELANEAKYYGRLAKVASRMGKTYAEMQMEGYEEGLQVAAQRRAEDATKHLMTDHEQEDYNSWGSTLGNMLQDGYDTISSIDLIPGQAWSNMGGKYAKDADFQASVWGGQFLGSLMSGPLTALAIGKDMQRFKAANKDLINSGVLDADEKFLRLRNSVLEKYFKNGQVEYLAGALRDLRNKKGEDGEALFDQNEMDKTARDIKQAYELYQDITDHVDARVGNDKYFGLFSSNELAVAKDKLKSDIFNAATAITMHTGALADLDKQIEEQKAKDGVFTAQGIIDTRTELEAKLEAAKESLRMHEARVSEVEGYKEPHWANKLANHVKVLNETIKNLTEELANTPKVDAPAPSAALVELMQKRGAAELNLADARSKYAEFSKIRTKEQLKDYTVKNSSRPVPPASPLAAETQKQTIESMVDRISKGEQMTTPEDIEFYKNNASAIEAALRQKAGGTGMAPSGAPATPSPMEAAANAAPISMTPTQTTPQGPSTSFGLADIQKGDKLRLFLREEMGISDSRDVEVVAVSDHGFKVAGDEKWHSKDTKRSPYVRVEKLQPQQAPTPAPVAEDSVEEKARKAVQADFKEVIKNNAGDYLNMGKGIFKIFKGIYGQNLPDRLTIADVINDLVDYWFKDDYNWIQANYEKIKSAIEAAFPGQAKMDLDPVTMTLVPEVEAGPVPSVQAGAWADDLNGKLNELAREANWEPGTGNKITNSLSIAQLNTKNEYVHFIDEKTHGDYRDDEGNLEFSEQSDQQLNNTNVVSVGDELTFILDPGAFNYNSDAKKQTLMRQRDNAIAEVQKEVTAFKTKAKSQHELNNMESILDGFSKRMESIENAYAIKIAGLDAADQAGIDASDMSDGNYDRAVIGVYKTVEHKSGNVTTSKTVRLGSLHRVAKLREILSDSVNGQPIDVDAEVDKLRAIRQRIISTGTEVKAKVTHKGFGYLNTRREKFTIKDAVGKDKRPYVTVIDNTGRPIALRGTRSIDIKGAGLKAGATVLMVPNGDVYIPIYLTKNTLSTDPAMQQMVYDSVVAFLSDGARKHLAPVNEKGQFGAEAFTFVTTNNKDVAAMNAGSGIYVHYNSKGEPAVTIGGNTFTAADNAGLKEAIGSVYVNTNRRLLTGQNAQKYADMLHASATLTTNIQANPVLLNRFDAGDYAFLQNDEQYSYFSQHTIGMGDVEGAAALPVAEAEVVPMTVEEIQKAEVIEEMEELGLGFDDLTAWADDVTPEKDSIKSRLMVSPEIPVSLQHEMVDSLAYLLLNAKPSPGTTNVEATKAQVGRIIAASEKAAATLEGSRAETAARAVVNQKLMLKHYDELIKRAQDVLASLGLKTREEDDYYENLEELGEDEGFTRFADDANATRNQKDFLPSDVRKLLYFLPELIPLDLTKPEDLERAKQGKNYKPAKNSLGLDSFNNFNDTWEKTLGVTSSRRFSSTKAGFDAMMSELKNPDNPPVVQELAAKVEKAPDQLKNAFFRNVNLQNQKNMTLMYTLNTVSNWVNKVREAFTKKTAFFVRSDRRSAQRKIIADLYNEFKANRTGLLTVVEDPTTGKESYMIDTEVSSQIYEEAKSIWSNDESYKTYKKRDKGVEKDVAGNYFTDEAKIKLYNLIKRTGLNLSWGAFKDVINSGVRSMSKAEGERAIFKDLFIDKYLKTLAGHQDETDTGVPFEKNNPFVKDSSVIETIALKEYKYRTLRRSGAYRLDGKSYYAYTRHNMLSEMFLDLHRGSDFVVNKLKFDIFARRSRILNKLNDPNEEEFSKSLELLYELGAKNRSTDNPTKLLKNMTPREHTIMRLAAYQNEGKTAAEFLYDTLSDKTTKPIVQMERLNVAGYTINDKGYVILSENVLDTMTNYFEAEYDRIKQVEEENKLFNDKSAGLRYKIIKNYHDNGKKMGMGKFFHIYYFLNKAFLDVDNPRLSSLMYNADGSLKEITADVRKGVRFEINKHFNKLFLKNKNDFAQLELFRLGSDNQGNTVADIQSFLDHKYLTRGLVALGSGKMDRGGAKGVLYNLGVSLTKDQLKQLEEGRYLDVLGMRTISNAIDYAVIDYVVNSAMFSNEMLMLTGDPAQAGKPAGKDEVKAIMEQHKDKPAEAAKWELLAHIMSTYVNLGKRNASFLASGEKGMFDNAHYNVAIANDISISSTHLQDYLRMFPDNVGGVTKAYNDGDLTDAQEITTVEEHLHVMKAFGKISDATYRKALYHFDRRAYNVMFPGSGETVTQEEKFELLGLVMQPMKPVQRTFTNEAEMKMSKQYYIKTSSYPLIPDLVKGTPLEALLNDMIAQGVNRVAFGSGVKQGIAGAQDIFSKDADGNDVYNAGFLTNNQNVLDRDGFRIQLEVPYKETKDHIREGTQQSKLMFVDIPQSVMVAFQGKETSVGDVQKAYIEYHRRIVDNQTKMLMEEIANPDGTINMKKLSRILQEEGEGRGYAMNSLLGLDLNERGQFKIPLTFLPNAGQMEPVITSIISNRVSRLKMPGKSYVQGSEFMLRRGKVEEGKDLDRRGIIWTKPEYHNMSKLSYLHVDENGQHHNSQIIMPFYFIKDGKKLRAEDFTKTLEDGRVVLDTDKVDPELLQMNGFRIPYQGHNSGMWFEIVGFLPEEAGDLVLVPGEIAGQMGSDYDVDKLYSYMYNYVHKNEYERLGADAADWERLKRLVNLKLADMGVEKDETGRYTKADYNSALYAVVEEEYVDKGKEVPKHKVLKSGNEKYEIAKIHEEDPTSTEALQNAIIDAQKAIYTSPDPGIMKAILDPLSFKDVEEAIEMLGSEGTTTFMGAFDPIYQRDTYFSNVTGKLATAICANANTSHAMAQGSNLYVKGQGVLFYDEMGNPYADRTGAGDENRVNEFTQDMYQYLVKTNEGEELVDQNDGKNNSAWRLDKVSTFPDPVTGTVYRISNLISQLLGVSVDNAKEQKLGAFGINKENLNVVLTIVRAGFSLNVAKAFINQPILKEFYEAIGDAEDIFEVDFTANKKDAVMTNLYKKYGKLAGMSDEAIGNFITRREITGFKFSDLRANLNAPVSQANALQQLEVFKAYQRYKQISDSLATLTGTFGIDVKGLPKNMAETAKKSEDIAKILRDNDTLGNVPRYADNTIPGLFLGIPDLAVDLFMNPSNPLFAYGSAAYIAAKDAVMELSGKKALFTDQIDLVHAHIKQFIYSGFIFPDGESIIDARNRLLFDTTDNESLQTRLSKLQTFYPKNELLQAMTMENSTNPADPKLLGIESSSEEDYVQKIQEYWENMLADNERADLKSFAYDLLKYAMYVQPQEFGPSNIIKYMPVGPMMSMGLSDYLNALNVMMGIPVDLSSYPANVQEALRNTEAGEEALQNFAKQFLRHNTEMLVGATQYDKAFINPQWTTRQELKTNERGEEYVRTLRVSLNQFTLPKIPTDPREFAKNKAAGLVRNGNYPKLLKFKTKEVDTQVYEGFENPDGTVTYYRIEQLGGTNVSEYSMQNPDPATIIGSNLPAAAGRPVSAVVNAMKAAGEVGQIQTTDYIRLKNADDMLAGMINSLNNLMLSDVKPLDKAYAEYYIYLAKQLQDTGLDKVRIILNNDLAVAGRTNPEGTVVQFSPRMIEKGGRTGLSVELERARVVLHEFLHARVHMAIREGKGSEEYKNIVKVHEAFRKAIRTASDNTIRGVSVSALDAEFFDVIKQRFDQSRSDLGGATFGKFVSDLIDDEARLRAVFEEVRVRLEELAAKGELADKNYDLISNTERFHQFREHVKKTFQNQPALEAMINKYYAYHSLDEFITEAMTNNKTQDMMRGIPSLWKSFVQSLKDFIAKLLGVETVDRTLFDDAIDTVFTYLRNTAAKSRQEGDEGSASNPHKMAMSFKDGDGGRQMRPEFAGKSTMDLILSGDRTATSRDLSKSYNKVDIRPGDFIEVSGDGKRAIVKATTSWYPVSSVSPQEWSALEGWDESRHADLVRQGYSQFRFELVKDLAEKKSYEGETVPYKYYGATYNIVLTQDGTPVRVEGYKGKYADEKKILDAYYNKVETHGSNNFGPAMTEQQQEKKGASAPLGKKEDMLNEGQKEAVEKAMKVLSDPQVHDNIFEDMFLLSGKGGTGKTFTTEVIVDKLRAQFPRAVIAHVAPTWNAVNEILRDAAENKTASTFASFVGTDLAEPDENGVQRFVLFNDEKLKSMSRAGVLPGVFSADYIILDEASMIGGDGKAPEQIGKDLVSTDAWETLKYRLQQREAMYGTAPKKILLVGDYAQIPPVGTKPDHDAIIIEKMLAKPETHHVLTQNMRSGNEDLNQLQEMYRQNIDKAREGIRRGKPSNMTIPRNPIAFETRTNSKNITYVRNADDAVDRYVRLYQQDPENVRNVVFVNYNRQQHPRTQALIAKIRQRLLGDAAKNEFNPGELLLLNGNLTSEVVIDNKNKTIIWHNETRFYVKDVVANVAETIGGLTFNGTKLRLVTDFGKKRVEFTTFVPNAGEVERVLGKYDHAKKGFNTQYGFVSYKDFKDKLEKRLPKLNYAYVVNSHKVQGSSYNHTFVDEQNILDSPDTNKGANNMLYTAVSRPKQTLTILNVNNPADQDAPVVKRTWGSTTNAVPLQKSNPMEYYNYSGGAKGADTAWDQIGREYGVTNHKHFRPEDLARYKPEDQDRIEAAYKKAQEALGRKFLEKNTFVGGLVRRDFLQVAYSDAVFAVSSIVAKGATNKEGYTAKSTQVDGGTGYAVQMAIDLGKPVYVFDQGRNQWFQAVYQTTTDGKKQFTGFTKSDVPVLTKKFAGVGSRELQDNGRQAIRDVYQKTFGPLSKNVDDITADNVIDELISRGLLKTKCK